GGGAPITRPLLISRSTINNLNLNLPSANVALTSSTIKAAPHDVTATMNWWNASTSNGIRAKIYDFYHTFNYGKVLFDNFKQVRASNSPC
ncbi:unnamed protein product, partial [Didymodactylos carnosus]